MSAAELRDHAADPDGDGVTDSGGSPLTVAPDAVEVRRNAGLAAAVGALASAVAIAYLARAVQTGALLDWVLVGTMGLLGIYWLAAFLDARTPLLVADGHGVRMRLGRTWRGLPWTAIQRVEHTPRRGLLRDGRLAVVARNPEKVLSELDASGARRAKAATRLYGEPFAVPLGLSTRVVGGGDDVQEALERVAARAAEVVIVEQATGTSAPDEDEPDHAEPHAVPEQPEEEAVEVDDSHTPRTRLRDPRPLLARSIARVASLAPVRRTDEVAEEDDDVPVETDEPEETQPIVASATPSPLRDAARARRSEVRRDLPSDHGGTADGVDDEQAGERPAGRELRRPGAVSLVEDTEVWGDRVRPIARQGDAVEPLVLDDFAIEPAEDPVIGPELVAARTRLGLTVDQLADRTRIRPHVIESIEVDDFVPCGGDFYARGHLRTLARVLGVDVTPLLASYDERYAHAPINPRRVFEAELATGAHGSIRGTRGGPNWSVLVAAVMAMVLCWSVARLVMETPTELNGATPVLNGSGGPDGAAMVVADPVPVEVEAVRGGARVVVRDGNGEIVFQGPLAAGEGKKLDVVPPIRVQTTDGALTVAVDGADPRAVGEAGEAGQGTFVPR
ncbi:MAG TPA: helix-turn-helix domain-containing protein [Nocardioides sp.]